MESTVLPAAPKRPPRRAQKALAWILSLSGAVIVDAVAVWGAMQIVEFRAVHTELALEAAPTRTPAPPRPTPTGPVEPPRDSRVPTDCDEVYSRDMASTLTGAGLVLQDATTPAVIEEPGSEDEVLRELLGERPLVECVWLDSGGGTQSGVLTVIAEATTERAAAVELRAGQLGMTRLVENGGHRWIVEGRTDAGVRTGESHFLRDGLWFATRWYGYGPFGYTSDMARQVFG